jgi:hypothetical protein
MWGQVLDMLEEEGCIGSELQVGGALQSMQSTVGLARYLYV